MPVCSPRRLPRWLDCLGAQHHGCWRQCTRVRRWGGGTWAVPLGTAVGGTVGRYPPTTIRRPCGIFVNPSPTSDLLGGCTTGAQCN